MIDRFLHGNRSRPEPLPIGADGADRAVEATAAETLPWVSRPDAEGGAFVPPPVELVR
jgi:hypothetical protein